MRAFFVILSISLLSVSLLFIAPSSAALPLFIFLFTCFFILGTACPLIFPQIPWIACVFIGLPVFLIIGPLNFSDYGPGETPAVRLLVAAASLLGTLAGSWMGQWLRKRRNGPQSDR